MSNSPAPRQYFRVLYPDFDRPTLEAGDQKLPVVELSEGGLKLPVSKADVPKEIAGTIQLLSGKFRAVKATYLRTAGSESIFHQLIGIAYADILDEQRYLIRKYGADILAK